MPLPPPTDDAPWVLRHDRDHVAWLTLNRPERLNALSRAMIDALDQALSALAADAHIRVVVIAAGGKAFSAGHNLNELHPCPSSDEALDLFNACSAMMLKIHHLPQPVIAQVDGIATAAGCQLVAQCDLAIASTASKFATSGINLGLFCATPSVPLTRTIGRKAAAEMLYTGRFISAETAAQLGLINRAVGAEVLAAEVENLALEIAAKSPTAIAQGKKVLRAHQDRPLDEAYDVAARAMADNLQDRGAQEGIGAFLNKRSQMKGDT